MSSDIWNPWHGCRKYSEGCDHCYMYYLDNERGKSGGEIYKVKTNSDLSSSVYHTRQGKNTPIRVKFSVCCSGLANDTKNPQTEWPGDVVEHCQRQLNPMCSAGTMNAKERRNGRCGLSAVACLLQAIVFPRHGFHKSTVFFGRIIVIHMKTLTGHE